MDKRISINQLAEYSTIKRESTKLRIIRQQKNPDRLRLPWYQLAKARIKKSLRNKGDLSPIYAAIEILTKRTPEKKWQKIDRNVSIEALEKYIGIELPKIISRNDLEIVRLEKSNFTVNGLNISISPELTFKFKDENGDSVIGAMKIHCGKNNSFENQTAQLASVVIYRFLKSVVAPSERVDPRYCFTIDIFGDRIVPAPINSKDYIKAIDELCVEIVKYWDAA